MHFMQNKKLETRLLHKAPRSHDPKDRDQLRKEKREADSSSGTRRRGNGSQGAGMAEGARPALNVPGWTENQKGPSGVDLTGQTLCLSEA
jgi:hypothetical protein